MTSRLSSLARLALGASALVLSLGWLGGCTSTVTGGAVDGEGGAGGIASSGDGGSGGSGAGTPVVSNAIAMRYDELPPPSGGPSTTSGGPEIDPNTIYLAIGNHSIACVDPFAAIDCGQWTVAFGIPPALQVPGVISLSSPEIIAYFSSTGPEPGPDCGFGGGSFFDGTLEIISINDEEIVGQLENTATFDFDANGPFTAARCF